MKKCSKSEILEIKMSRRMLVEWTEVEDDQLNKIPILISVPDLDNYTEEEKADIRTAVRDALDKYYEL